VTIFGLLFTPAFYALVRRSKLKTDRKTHASILTTAAGLILLLSVFLQGCSVGPKYKAPPPPGAELAPLSNAGSCCVRPVRETRYRPPAA
jgi:hypothetical protein